MMKTSIFKKIFFISFLYAGLSCQEKEICYTCLGYEKDIPPIAKAGVDIIVKYDPQICSYETVTLDGAASSDPDGNITRYKWSVISPFNGEIPPYESKIIFSPSGNGEYLIQLQVIDNLGKYAFDTVKVTVINDVSKTVTVQPINFTFISDIPAIFRGSVLIGGSETKLLFELPNENSISPSHKIALLDIPTQQWKEINVTQPRDGASPIIAGDKIFFAGGGYRTENSWTYSSEKTVDIYEIGSGKLTTSNLTDARTGAGSEYFEKKIYFIGGTQYGANESEKVINNIEIYDTLVKSWSIIPLPANSGNNYVRVENKLYFLDFASVAESRIIFIYDMATNTWSDSPSNMSFTLNSGTAVKNDIYWLGKHLKSSSHQYTNGALIMYNTRNQISTYICLPEQVYEAQIIVSKNNDVMIFNPYPDSYNPNSTIGYIFNPSAGKWYLGRSNIAFSFLQIRQHGSEIFGLADNKIYRIDF